MIFQITLHFLKNALSQVFLIVKPVDFKDFLTPHFNHSLSYPLDRKGLFVYLSRYEWFFLSKDAFAWCSLWTTKTRHT